MGELWLLSAFSERKKQSAFSFLSDKYFPVLSASCNLHRRRAGKQSFVRNCPHFCEKYTLTYPEHLHMIGRYNSLFGLDLETLMHRKYLKRRKKQESTGLCWG
ncbi:MAG: hypothetical protein ACLTN0_03175 [Coprococcus phoceensis]